MDYRGSKVTAKLFMDVLTGNAASAQAPAGGVGKGRDEQSVFLWVWIDWVDFECPDLNPPWGFFSLFPDSWTEQL